MLVGAVVWYAQRAFPREPFAPITGRTLTGAPRALPDGKPVVIHVWATWCGVCKVEEPNVKALADDARVISIASMSGHPSLVARYVREHGLPYEVLSDPNGDLAHALGVSAFPTTLFVNADGVVVAREVGYVTTLGLRARWWLLTHGFLPG